MCTPMPPQVTEISTPGTKRRPALVTDLHRLLAMLGLVSLRRKRGARLH